MNMIKACVLLVFLESAAILCGMPQQQMGALIINDAGEEIIWAARYTENILELYKTTNTHGRHVPLPIFEQEKEVGIFNLSNFQLPNLNPAYVLRPDKVDEYPVQSIFSMALTRHDDISILQLFNCIVEDMQVYDVQGNVIMTIDDIRNVLALELTGYGVIITDEIIQAGSATAPCRALPEKF
jgi:hypothetical protein